MPATLDIDPLDLVDPERHQRNGVPHEQLARLRALSPVTYFEPPGFPPFWAIVKHADILEIEQKPELFPSTLRVELESLEATRVAEEAGTAPETLVHMDGVKHRQYRGVTAGWFSAATAFR